MAIITGVGTLNVIAGFASGLAAVMTGRAGTGCYATVIEHRTIPGNGGMAVVAEVAALYVIGRFAACCLVVMATVTGTDDGKVIDA